MLRIRCGGDAILLMNGSRGRQTFDLEVVGVCQESNHRHGIIRFVFNVREDEHARLFGGRSDGKLTADE